MLRIKNERLNKAASAVSRAEFISVMVGRESQGFVSFDDVRKKLGKTKNELTDGAIHQAAIDEGFEVE